MPKKKVVYLLGAGATEAVVKHLNPVNGLLTPDIQSTIRKNHRSNRGGLSDRIWDELVTDDNDIEHLISVLDSQHDSHAAETVRKLYREAIIKGLTKAISDEPPSNNLYAVLMDLHNADKLQEDLLCFLSLNYEDILERTIALHFNKRIDYDIETDQVTLVTAKKTKVLKLHGSFTWKNCRPISVKRIDELTANNTLWIPPGVDKRRDNYPFNLLWGKAIEYLMQCDVVRIVGCSLSRNDWGLIPILYTVQKFNERGSGIEIEIIDFTYIAKGIGERYNYLNIKSLAQLPDVLGFYRKLIGGGSDDAIARLINDRHKERKGNPMAEWLDAKLDYLVNKRGATLSKAPIAHKFYHKL